MSGEKTEEGEKVVVDLDFATSTDVGDLTWLFEPKSATVEGGVLVVKPNPATDYWRDTYYVPRMRKHDAAVLGTNMDSDFMLETSFVLHPKVQFDQAGLAVVLDENTWLKTGIEYVDGSCRLSCVVTNTFSDWSTQNWPSTALAIRVHRINKLDFAVEYQADDGEWVMIRIAHFNVSDEEKLKKPVFAGVYLAAPNKDVTEFTTDFKCVKITTGGRAFHHDV